MNRRITTYNAETQWMGQFLRGYQWAIYGCGTLRRGDARQAKSSLRTFLQQLPTLIKAPVAAYAILEGRYAGLGLSPIPLHWHFLLATPASGNVSRTATLLWQDLNGNALITPYDPSRYAAFYSTKLAFHDNGEIFTWNMDRLPYSGSDDLLKDGMSNTYIPDRLKTKTSGTFLVMRDS